MQMIRTCALLAASVLLLSACALADEPITYTLDETYAVEKGGTIYLSTDDANIRIQGQDREDVHLRVDYRLEVTGFGSRKGGSFEMMVEERDGDLRIYDTQGSVSYNVFMGSVHEDYDVVLEVPHEVNLNLRGDDDDYRISDIRGSLELRMEDGDAYVENVQGERVEVDVEDGEFYLRGSGGILLASAEDGDIIIEEGSFSSATVLLEDGDLELETSLADEGDYRFRCEDGDMDLTFTGGGGEIEAEYDDGDVHASGDLEELEEDEEYVRWHYGKGSARVRLATEDGNIRLRAR